MTLAPLTAHIPDAAITDLCGRLARTRWPEAETVGDGLQDIPLGYLKEAGDYWSHFPSLEHPKTFVSEVRNGLRALR